MVKLSNYLNKSRINYITYLRINKNPTLGVGFGKAYSYTNDRETPFAIILMRSANCKGAKGGH